MLVKNPVASKLKFDKKTHLSTNSNLVTKKLMFYEKAKLFNNLNVMK